jgi:hypothetical protein
LSRLLGGTLHTANQALVAEILPFVSGAARYQALMVARVLAIGSREAEHGGEAQRQELFGIELLVPEAAKADGGEAKDAEELLARRRRALCSEIRNGRFDAAGPAQDALLDTLRSRPRIACGSTTRRSWTHDAMRCPPRAVWRWSTGRLRRPGRATSRKTHRPCRRARRQVVNRRNRPAERAGARTASRCRRRRGDARDTRRHRLPTGEHRRRG